MSDLKEAKDRLNEVLSVIEDLGEREDLIAKRERRQQKIDSIQAKYNVANKMPYNAVEPTFHFVVVDGKGFDVQKKLYYYHFMEVGVSSKANGINLNNRLYIYDNEIKGTRGFDTREYILTEIRKHSLSGSACP